MVISEGQCFAAVTLIHVLRAMRELDLNIVQPIFDSRIITVFFAIVLGLRLITAMGQIEKINWTRTEDVEVKCFFVLL